MFRGNLLGTGVAGTTLPDDPKLLWTFDTESEIEGTAAIVGGVVYFGDYEGRVYALTLAEGRELWRFEAGTPIKAPVSVFGDVVYVGDEYGYVYALDAATGEQQWKFETLGEIYAGVSLYESPGGRGPPAGRLLRQTRSTAWTAPAARRSGRWRRRVTSTARPRSPAA